VKKEGYLSGDFAPFIWGRSSLVEVTSERGGSIGGLKKMSIWPSHKLSRAKASKGDGRWVAAQASGFNSIDKRGKGRRGEDQLSRGT